MIVEQFLVLFEQKAAGTQDLQHDDLRHGPTLLSLECWRALPRPHWHHPMKQEALPGYVGYDAGAAVVRAACWLYYRDFPWLISQDQRTRQRRSLQRKNSKNVRKKAVFSIFFTCDSCGFSCHIRGPSLRIRRWCPERRNQRTIEKNNVHSSVSSSVLAYGFCGPSSLSCDQTWS